MPDPISKLDMRELHRVLNNSTLFSYPTPSVATEDDSGTVTLSDPDTGAPRMHMPREDFDALLAWKPPPVWKDTDPRFDIYKRADIIIVRPRTPGFNRPPACMGYVETKHAYSINTGFEAPYDHIDSGDDWPEDWQWTGFPKGS